MTNNGTFIFNRSGDFTFGGVISGSGGLTQNGNIVRLTAAQTYTGPTRIDAGILVLPTTVDSGLSASTTVTLAAGAKLDLSGHLQTVAGLAGAGTVYSFGSSNGALTTAVAYQQAYDFSGTLGGSDPAFAFTMAGDGTQILSGANTYTGMTTIKAGAGTLQIGHGGTTGSLNPNSTIINSATLAFDRSDTIRQGTDFAGGISGVGRLIQRGTGTVVLNTENSYTGGTIVASGTLQLGSGGTAGSVVGDIANAGTVAFNRSDDFTFGGVITGSGGVVNNGGIVRLTYSQYYTGPTVINSGILVLTTGGDQGISTASAVTVATGASLDLSNHALTLTGLSGGGTIYSYGGSAGSLTLDVAPGQTQAFSGNLGGSSPAFAVTKSNIGTMVLSGANTFTGRTTVTGGTLSIDFGTVSANVLPSASTLAMGGGTLSFSGTGTQTLNALITLPGTVSNIVLGANQTLSFGGLTSAGAGSSLNFDTSAGGANANLLNLGTGIVVLPGQTAGTVLNPGFTVLDRGGFGYATVNASNQVIRLTTSTDLLPSSGALSTTAYTVDNNAGGPGAAGSSNLTLSANATASGILVDTSAASGTLTLDSGVVVRNNTWNFSGVGNNPYTITGNTAGAGLRPAATGDSIAINNYNPGVVTIESPILADGVNTVVVNGTGTTVFSGTSTYTGGTIVNGGTLQFGDGIHALSFNGSAGGNGGQGALNAAGGSGVAGGIAVALNDDAALTVSPGVIVTGGAGGAGGIGYGWQNANAANYGFSGGAGGPGGIGIAVASSGELQIAQATGGSGGAGGQGGSSNAQYPDIKAAGAGGAGGAGGTGLAIGDDHTPSALSGGIITGGVGGAGGPGGWGYYYGTTGTGGTGGSGGAGITLGTSAVLDFQMVTGGNGGAGGAGGVEAGLSGNGPVGASGTGGTGGAGVIVSNGSAIMVPDSADIAGGAGGSALYGTTSVGATTSRGGDGGAGGAGMVFSFGGILTNNGTISGGQGSAGGNGGQSIYFIQQGPAGNGGQGGSGVLFLRGGTLANGGTISAGNGGAGGYSPIGSGLVGGKGSGVVFSGGAGTLSNQSGGVINGGAIFGNYANTVTLATGSTINGDLNLNTHPGSTLTLTGSGSATWSQAVTGVTTFAGSLAKTGSGTWTLDQAFAYAGGTTISAGTINLANTSGSAFGTGSVTVESGAFLTGTGSFTGALTVNPGGTLAPGNPPGLMTIGSGSVLNGTVAMQLGGLVRGTDYDAIDVADAGALTFGGALDLSLINGFSPALGDSFDLFDFTTGTGEFDTLDLPTLAAGLTWDVSGLYTTGTLTIAASAIPEPCTFAFVLGLCALAAGLVSRRRARAEPRA
ncbi:MAG TPA: autotransporter-associated beta strand repeat-containing protein [Opitutus sp.]|nr:autotransporter-associated beta strand repeat-containing protein [Opitutus sp.]